MVELEITAVDDQAGRRCDTQANRIGDGMADVIGLDGKRADIDRVAGGVGVQRGLLQHPLLLQLDLDQSSGQARGVHRRVELLQEMGEGAYVV